MRSQCAAPFGFALIQCLAISVGPCAAATTDPTDRRDLPHTEVGVLPAFGISSDTGVSLGAFLQVARFEKGARPYAWRSRFQLAASFRVDDQRLTLPYHDDFVRFDAPEFPYRDGRLFVDAAYQRLTLAGYFGIGNASSSQLASEHATHYLSELVFLRGGIQHAPRQSPWRGQVGVVAAYYDARVYPDSQLQLDLANGSGPSGTGRYAQASLFAGLVLDTRDHETYPTRGMFHDLVVRSAPCGINRHAFSSLSLTTRYYVSVFGGALVLAGRLLGDVQAGDVPLYDLSRAFGLQPAPAPGGMNSVRGVPQGRYAGKTKVVANLEARALPLRFAIAAEQMAIGPALFVDTGRVWTDTLAVDSSRDGSGVGLHWGLGGGVRWRWGDSLLVRLDAAYAPNASASGNRSNTGVYVTTDSPF